MRAFACSSFAAVAIAIAGCGGNVHVDGEGAGGATSGSASGPTATISATSVTAVTSTGTFVSSSVSTGPSVPSCDAFAPFAIGSACTPGTECVMTSACCGAHAICENGAWVATGPLCNMPCIPCGDALACAIDAICVLNQAFLETAFCAPSPCPQGALDCSCAASLCGGSSFSCSGTTQNTVFCDCPTCAQE